MTLVVTHWVTRVKQRERVSVHPRVDFPVIASSEPPRTGIPMTRPGMLESSRSGSSRKPRLLETIVPTARGWLGWSSLGSGAGLTSEAVSSFQPYRTGWLPVGVQWSTAFAAPPLSLAEQRNSPGPWIPFREIGSSPRKARRVRDVTCFPPRSMCRLRQRSSRRLLVKPIPRPQRVVRHREHLILAEQRDRGLRVAVVEQPCAPIGA